MNKTLIVLGVGIWCVMLILRFVPLTNADQTLFLLNIIEIVAFVITLIGIIKNN